MLPTKPGIYWFKNAKKDILYIGKAKNLKNRLTSYKLKTNQVGKTKLLLRQAAQIQWTILDSELQALILEAKLIKSYQPKYNIRLKDDRSPLYIVITKEKYPRILTLRKTQITPAPSHLQTNSFSILNWFGPFPSGYKSRLLLKKLRKIFPFCNAPSKQKALGKACFYYHLKLCPGACTGQISPRKYRTIIRNLSQFLSGRSHAVTQKLTRRMKTASAAKDYETAASIRDQLQLIQTTNSVHLQSFDKDELTRSVAINNQLHHLKTTLNLQKIPRRIEGYDISNIQGKFSNGSMVVFIQAVAKPDQYRRFRIRKLNAPDDTAMIAQVISRRATHLEWPTPDLIIIDGGKGQVNAARKALSSSKIQSHFKKIPLVGIAKKDERLIFNNRQLRLPSSSPTRQLVQKIRDESHRFAQAYYHHLHQRHLLKGKEPQRSQTKKSGASS